MSKSYQFKSKAIPGKKSSVYDAPCSLAEVLKLSRAAAEDVVEGALAEYQKHTSPIQVAISIQIELLKDTLIEAGIITEDRFKELYTQRVEEFNRMQKEFFDSQKKEEELSMKVSSGDIEVKEEEQDGINRE